MSDIPSWRSKIKHTSDPDAVEQEITKGEQTKSLYICKVCRQPLNEAEKKIICPKCQQYAHVECSNRFDMAPHCDLCIIESTKVSKSAFEFLYGMMKNHKQSRIKKAAGFTSAEVKQVKSELIDAGVLAWKKFLWLKQIQVTYLAREVFPVLEKIYCKEMDVQEFIKRLVEV